MNKAKKLGNTDALTKYQTDRFFEKFGPISQDVCDNEAANISGGGTIKPTPMQGAQSYTVQVLSDAKSLIVQFRDPKSPIDLDLMTTARETYGRLVPNCQHLKERPGTLLVYKMNYLSGETFLLARTALRNAENFGLLSQTVQDFAVFFASAWNNRLASILAFNSSLIQNDYLSRLERISNKLPVSFSPLLDKLKSQLPSLFPDDYPMVIIYWDLVENIIHVDIQTGHLTGIVDWRDAEVGPFALQLWGLENIIGIRTTTGMCFHPQHIQLCRLFWQNIYEEIGDVSKGVKEAIHTARMIGIFLANGDFAGAPANTREMEEAVLRSITLD
ncbi:Protein kinase-like protein [Penicillium frequentans]|uniref:Protein kinase-like protein n=1 Tax=Penicillium frequentans TaxID=3151616 RepID=A0AAD6GAL9_9EURO|nr:Protein kinase-like protein [Penicillium glabrum]